MENILMAFIIISLALLAMLSLTEDAINSQADFQSSWHEIEKRQNEQNATSIELSCTADASGTKIGFMVYNAGSTRLAFFEDWDVIMQFTSVNGKHHIKRLTYTDKTNPGNGKWTVGGIYLDALGLFAEQYEPQIFNPQEYILLIAKIAPPVQDNDWSHIVVSTPNGITAESQIGDLMCSGL